MQVIFSMALYIWRNFHIVFLLGEGGGVPLWGPQNKGLGSILGYPNMGKLPYRPPNDSRGSPNAQYAERSEHQSVNLHRLHLL